MKQLELKLNKRILIIESESGNYAYDYPVDEEGPHPIKKICKGSDLTEDIAKGFQHKNMGIAHNGEYLSAIEEFKFHISNHGYHWGENPVKNPESIDIIPASFGWWLRQSKKHEEAQARTFNPSQCIIFEIL